MTVTLAKGSAIAGLIVAPTLLCSAILWITGSLNRNEHRTAAREVIRRHIQDVPALESVETARLRARLESLETMLRERDTEEGVTPAEPEEIGSIAEKTAVESAAEREREFWAQPPRSVWGERVRDDLRRLGDEGRLGGTAEVRSIDCRATSCRLEVQHETAQSVRAFSDTIAWEPALMGHQIDYYSIDAEGLDQVVYVSVPLEE